METHTSDGLKIDRWHSWFGWMVEMSGEFAAQAAPCSAQEVMESFPRKGPPGLAAVTHTQGSCSLSDWTQSLRGDKASPRIDQLQYEEFG